MQALWSRTAQASSCQCGICLQAAARFVRTSRTVTASRRLRASDVFTASFSAMLATAAVLDSRKKDKRMLQWDHAIAEVRSGKDLATIRTPDQVSIGKAATGSSNIMGSQTREYSPGTNRDSKLEQNATTVKQILSTVPIPILEAYKSSLKPSEPMTAVWDRLMALLSESVEASANLECVLTPSERPGATELQNKCPSGDKVDSRQFSVVSMKHREPKTQYHLNLLERGVYALVCELWKTTLMGRHKTPETENGLCWTKNIANDMKLEIKQITERIAALLDGSKPVPMYQLVSPVGTRNSRGDLNRTIASILKSDDVRQGNLELMIAKVCYALLTSSVAPSITTYNIMMENFTRRQQYELTEVVVTAFKGSRFRPNERTLSALLGYYRVVNNRAMFQKTIRQMAGLEAGLGLTRKHLYYLKEPSVKHWASTSDVIHRRGFIQEKIHRNSQVFESLILGSLQFVGLRAALGYVKKAIKEGCQIRAHVIVNLVRRCLATKGSGDVLIYLLSALSLQWKEGMELRGGVLYDSRIRNCLHDVLEACGLGSAISGAAVSLPRSIPPESFARMLRHIKDEEAKEFITHHSQKSQLLDPEPDSDRVGKSLLNDTPSFAKMSQIARKRQDRESRAILCAPPPPIQRVEVDNAAVIASGRQVAIHSVAKTHVRFPPKTEDYGRGSVMPQLHSVSPEACI